MTSMHDCDRAIAAATPGGGDRGTATHPRWVLATTVLASSLAFVDGSIVNVGLPAIGNGLGSGANGESLSWVINAYLLPLSALLLLGGAAGDRFGRRRVLLLGVAVFALASLLCGLAPSLQWLLAGRCLQGVGAALLMPSSLAILGSSFDGAARGRAIGVWAASGAAAGAVAPLLGGWLIDMLGWRSMFIVNLPLAAAAALLALRYVPDARDDKRPPLDLGGAALVTTGLASLTWGLTVASGEGGLGRAAAAALAGGGVLLLLFALLEHRRGTRAMVPLALFGSRRFVGLTLLTLLLYGALGGVLVLAPYVLIQARGYSATQAGAALLPLPLVIALASPLMGRWAAGSGARWPLTLGPAIVAVGFALAWRIGGDGSYWSAVLPAFAVIALGMSFAVAPLTTAVLSSVDMQHTGVASGLNSAVARTGGLVATALLTLVLAAQGAELARLFGWAMLACSGAALLASAVAWLGLRETPS